MGPHIHPRWVSERSFLALRHLLGGRVPVFLESALRLCRDSPRAATVKTAVEIPVMLGLADECSYGGRGVPVVAVFPCRLVWSGVACADVVPSTSL